MIDKKWLRHDAGEDGVSVAPDGTIYTGNTEYVKAWQPDGALLWTYPISGIYFYGPAVGPDGNIYGVGVNEIGSFSLTPQGELRWSTPEQLGRPFNATADIEFGYDGEQLQMYFFGNAAMKAINADNGNIEWLGVEYGHPQVGPDNSIYHGEQNTIIRYNPDGDVVDSFESPTPVNDLTRVCIAANTGDLYQVQNFNTIRSFDAQLNVRWERVIDNTSLLMPCPDADNSVIVTGAHENGWRIAGFSTSNGDELWNVELPVDPGMTAHGVDRVRFTADGNTVYVATHLAAEDYDYNDHYFYLYAIDSNSDDDTTQVPTAVQLVGGSAAGAAVAWLPLLAVLLLGAASVALWRSQPD